MTASRRTGLLALLFVAAWVARNEASAALNFGQYGDYHALVNLVQSDEPFSRWLVGGHILRGAYRVSHYLADTSAVGFVLQASRGWHLVAGLAVLLAFPRWAVFMALTCPMLLHFGAGYSEYYPFIAPMFVAVAMGHVERRFDEVPAWAVGAGCALLVLFYVGFLPLAVLVAASSLGRDRKRLGLAAGSALATGGVVSLALAGPGFLAQLFHDLNTGDPKAYPGQAGWAIPGTPFFWPGVMLEHLPEFLASVSRGVGIGPMLAGLALAWTDRRLGILVWCYALISAFTIPRLGALGDTDLYFQFYALSALAIGYAIDASLRPTSESRA